MSEFRMPSLGADMEAGTLVEWLKQPGDAVKRGDVIAVVETQKGAIEIDVFENGVLERLLVAEGTTVPVGTPLALIAVEGSAAGPVSAPAAPAVTMPIRPPIAAPELTPPPRLAGQRILASPAARRLAETRNIDLSQLRGAGPGGAVTSRDVEKAPIKPPTRGLDLAEMRRAIAAAMARSKREIPHYYLSATIDIGAALDWLAKTNAERPPPERILLGALLLKAMSLAVRKMPEFNGFFSEIGYAPSAAIHPGVAISLRGGGLIAPAIHDVDQLSLGELMARMRDLVARARRGGLRSSEMADATITMSSLGERGVDAVFGVIYPPQVALVGFGSPAVRPWVIDGALAARLVIVASLSGDHRVSDGHRGALFLAEIDRLLQLPEAL